MTDDLSRRQLVRRAALLAGLPALARLAPGCARRLSPEREIEVPCPTDTRQRLLLSPALAPELGRAGGAVLVRVRGLSGGQDKFLLVANAGTGFVAVDGLCTHQSCEVTWVQEDRQVECPCHLSRFASDGAVLHAPAVTPLTAYPASLDASGSVAVELATGDGVFPAVQNGQLVISLANYPALQSPGGAVLGHAEGHIGPIIVARLNDGGLVAFDAICTHLGCTVHPAQTGTLHCPCHGSTFSISPDLSNPQRPQPVPGWALVGPAGPPLATFQTVLSPDLKTATVTFPPVCP
jgi:cytochrome b6-f complex iron-sulfur subunit